MQRGGEGRQEARHAPRSAPALGVRQQAQRLERGAARARVAARQPALAEGRQAVARAAAHALRARTTAWSRAGRPTAETQDTPQARGAPIWPLQGP